ncbi:MAG: hypothetical protein QF886_14425, partial [Planctomycetota bacterium]|nr:hypothetical protein [Planctomycetota bacterium]
MRYRTRLSTLFGIISLFCFVVVPIRLFQLQILNGGYYRKAVEERRVRQDSVDAPRGKIVDRNGLILAREVPAYELQIYFRRFDDPKYDRKDSVKKISKAVGMSEGEIYRQLNELRDK